MTRIAAIDLGTHNCRLMVAEADKDGFKPLRITSKIVRLGEGAAKSGRLQPEAIARTIAALKDFTNIIRDEGVSQIYAVATEACRMADNCDDFLQAVRDQCGLELEIITAEEEVRITTLATWPLIKENPGRVMTLDIGGGSTELVLLEFKAGVITITDWRSFPMGVVRGRDEMDNPEVTAAEFRTMSEDYAKPMASFFEKNAGFFNRDFQVIGSSGTVTTLAATLENLKHYQRHLIDGLKCRVPDMVDLAGKTARKPMTERSADPLMGPSRAEYMVPGCAIFCAIFSYLQANFMTAADRGLREGIINSHLPDVPKVVFQKAAK